LGILKIPLEPIDEEGRMGIIYFIGCKDCKVKRDLDKFYTSSFGSGIDTREKALEYAKKEIAKDTFRCGLLVSFLADHKDHNCVFFDEHNDQLYEDLKEDKNFW
jgi:hypothetical protein